jgi:hypothetical protein
LSHDRWAGIKKTRPNGAFSFFESTGTVLFSLLGLDTVLAVEALNASRGVHELLLAGKEGMAGRTNFNL